MAEKLPRAPEPPVRGVRLIYLDETRPPTVVYGVERAKEHGDYIKLYREGKIVAAFLGADIKRHEEIR